MNLTHRYIVWLLLPIACLVSPLREAAFAQTTAVTSDTSIVGEWSNVNRRICFASDGFYRDSLFYPETSDTLKRSLGQAYMGKYTIGGGFLFFDEWDCQFTDTSRFHGAVRRIPTGAEIFISGDTMRLKAVDVLYPKDNRHDSLWGEWALHKREGLWGNSPVNGNTVFLTDTYTFPKDSTIFRLRRAYNGGLYVSSSAGAYTYGTPVLILKNPISDKITVRFRSGKMYWYYDIPDQIFKRVTK